jgi:hypothetical protein
MPIIAEITYYTIQEKLPDDETLVIIRTDSDDYGSGFIVGSQWYWSDALEAVNVTHWADFPEVK